MRRHRRIIYAGGICPYSGLDLCIIVEEALEIHFQKIVRSNWHTGISSRELPNSGFISDPDIITTAISGLLTEHMWEYVVFLRPRARYPVVSSAGIEVHSRVFFLLPQSVAPSSIRSVMPACIYCFRPCPSV